MGVTFGEDEGCNSRDSSSSARRDIWNGSFEAALSTVGLLASIGPSNGLQVEEERVGGQFVWQRLPRQTKANYK